MLRILTVTHEVVLCIVVTRRSQRQPEIGLAEVSLYTEFFGKKMEVDLAQMYLRPFI
ncbi:MAG: hypothetical protein K0R10_1969, partial [Alphaproteobacteria bacterium]|nr:hypothetical protein [Alphaproteobacteria bacterium]